MKSSPPSPRSSPDRLRLALRSLSAMSFALLLFGALQGTSLADLPTLQAAAREVLPKDRLFPVPFGHGETLTYTLSWLQIEGGEMTLATSRETTPDGVPVHRIALTATSNDYVSKFYPVKDRYETWVDARDFQPIRFEKHAREGRYSSDEVEEFDLEKKIAAWRDKRTPLPERVQDIISTFYFMRTLNFAAGQRVDMEMYSRGKIYRIQATVLGREKVETDVGTFDAWKVQPAMRETESAADRNKGQLFLWFSDDDRKMPVMVKTILPIGSVTARLKSASPATTTAVK